MAQWPGNIRQLSHLLWRSVLLCNQEMLDVGDIRLIQQLQPVYYGGYHDNALSAASPLLFDGQGQIKKLKSIEDEVIRFALRYSDGCMTRAARTLGIGRSTLYRRVNELEPAAMHNASEAR
jgi:DNA-binding NtrC family response regulator